MVFPRFMQPIHTLPKLGTILLSAFLFVVFHLQLAASPLQDKADSVLVSAVSESDSANIIQTIDSTEVADNQPAKHSSGYLSPLEEIAETVLDVFMGSILCFLAFLYLKVRIRSSKKSPTPNDDDQPTHADEQDDHYQK